MKIGGKFKLYILELVLVGFLFFTLFASYITTRWVLAIFLIIYLIVIKLVIQRKVAKSIYNKQLIILLGIFALIYLAVFYALGLRFGFVKSKYLFTISNIFGIILPTTIIIIVSEVIRCILLKQDGIFKIRGRKINLSVFLIYVSMVLIDYDLYAKAFNLNKLEDFLMAIGLILFASMANNLLFNYISKRFNSQAIIIYRLITVLYMYLIPYQPEVYIFLRIFLRVLYAFILYLIIERTFAKNDFALSYKERKKSIFWTSIIFVIVTLMIMLISCQFRYGIIVIGSQSMTGTINKGDAVIYEQNRGNQKIYKGQIVMFVYNDIKTIHRVVEIKNINGEVRYYTKGDANEDYDTGYRLIEDIEGLVRIKIKYIGIPTLWVRSLFD